MQLFEDLSNAIKLGSKRYDQSVTCLADDPWNLETRRSTLRTPGIANKQYIHKQSSKGAWNKTQNKRSNQKFQLKNSGLQKESNQTKQQNSNGERNKLRLLIWYKVKFYSSKNLFKLVKQKEGFETKL